MKTALAIFVCFLICICGAIPTSKSLRGSIEFNFGDYVVFWELNAEKTRLTFDVTVLNQGWFGIGFSESGTMINADMAVAQVVTNPDGTKVLDLKDYHSITSNNVPILDSIQNLEDIRTERNETYSLIHFTRECDTGDDEDMALPLNGVYVLWAFSENVEQMEYHRNNAGQGFVVFDESLVQ